MDATHNNRPTSAPGVDLHVGGRRTAGEGTTVKRPNPKAQQRLVDAWTLPEGALVIVRRDDGSETNTTTCSAPWLFGGHTAVIMLDGISECYALDRVRPAVKVA